MVLNYTEGKHVCIAYYLRCARDKELFLRGTELNNEYFSIENYCNVFHTVTDAV